MPPHDTALTNLTCTPLLWIAFFLNAAMVFGGFIRGLEGSILLACSAVDRYRKE